jgi:hypothetical protein
MSRVRVPSPALRVGSQKREDAGAGGKSPPDVEKDEAARVAQLVEHTLGKGEVIGSIPIASLYNNGTQLRTK